MRRDATGPNPIPANGALLAGDVGGTKTILALFPLAGDPRAPIAEATFASGQFDSLEAVARAFLAPLDARIERVVIGVAGPVLDGAARITNLPWAIHADRLAAAVGARQARLLNDLEAIGAAVPHLRGQEIETLHAGSAVARGAIAVVAPGTGLGEAYLTWNGNRYDAHASEGGHATFAPADDTQTDLLAWLRQRFDHVSFERVCSGMGIPSLYDFLRDTGRVAPTASVEAAIAAADDPTPVIVRAALDSDAPCPLCVASLRLFASILANEAGNLALKVLATGGVFIGGGMPRRLLPLLREPGFLVAFRSKGRMRDLLARVPVHVILDPRAGLIGAAIVGLDAR